MPGRHSGGSSLGGGGSGSGGGFRGGGFGGGWGGGFGGPGWGWRPRGPWFRPRPVYPLWGGWGGGWGWGGWMPWLFGPRFGGGGGCGGCGCLFILAIGILFVCLSGGFMGLGGRDYGYNYNPVGGYNPVAPANNSQGGANLASEPAAIQTQTAVDLTELHAAFDSRIPEWQSQLASNESKSIPPADAGLTRDNNTKEVLYGKCGSGFYLFVVENTKPDTGPADGEGYAYTTASSPGACHPPHWAVYDSEAVGGNWYFTTLKSQ